MHLIAACICFLISFLQATTVLGDTAPGDAAPGDAALGSDAPVEALERSLDPRAADTEAERNRVVEQYYDLYARLVDPLGKELQIELSNFREISPDRFSEVDPLAISDVDPRGWVALRSAASESDPKARDYSIEWREFLAEDLESWHTNRLAQAGTSFEESIAEPLKGILQDELGKDLSQLALATYTVRLTDGRAKELSYPAFSIWYVEQEAGSPLFVSFDASLEGLQNLRDILKAVPSEDSARVTKPAVEEPPIESTKSDATCEPTPETIYTYPTAPPGSSWKTGATVSKDPAHLRYYDNYGHYPETYHSFWVKPSVTCSCTSGCDSSGTLDLNDNGVSDTDFWSAWGTDKHYPLDHCHQGPSDVAMIAPAPHQVREGGDGVWLNGAVGWGIANCYIAAGLCFCNSVSASFGAGTKLPNNMELSGGLEVTISPTPQDSWIIPVSVQCPPCEKQFPVEAQVSGLANGTTIEATVTVSEEEGGPGETFTKTATQTGPDGEAIHFRVLDGAGDDAFFPNGHYVRMEVDIVSSPEDPPPTCHPVHTWISGSKLVLRRECGCDDTKSTGTCAGGPEYKVSGRIGATGVDSVSFQLELSTPQGTQPAESRTESLGTLTAPSSSTELEFTSRNSAPTGWSYQIHPSLSPHVKCSAAHGVIGNGPVTGADMICVGGEVIEKWSKIQTRKDTHDWCELIECDRWDLPDITLLPWNVGDPDAFGNDDPCVPEATGCTSRFVCDYTEPDPEKRCREVVDCTASCNPVTYKGPEIGVTTPAADSVVSGAITLAGTANDEDGVTALKVYVGYEPVDLIGFSYSGGQFSGALDTTLLPDGQHTIRVAASDGRVGNEVLTIFEHSIRVDNACSGASSPQVQFTPVDGASLAPGSNPIVVTPTDPAGIHHIRVLVDDQLVGILDSSPWQLDWNATSGDHTLTVRAYDNCNNETEVSHEVSVCEGPENPTITLTHPTDGATLTEGETITLTAAASDDVGVTQVRFYRENGITLGTDTTVPYSLDWTVVDGATEIKARAWDHCGNTAAEAAAITVVPAATPTLVVMTQDNTVLAYGDTLDWGALDYGVENNEWKGWRLFPKVRNDGSADLETSLSLPQSTGGRFSIGANVVDNPLVAGAQDFFVMRLFTDIAGTFQGQLAITHNDPSQPNPFLLNLAGTVRAAPQVQVSRATNVLDPGETLNIGTFSQNSGTKNRAITVENLAPAGATELEWGPVEVTNTQGSAFTWSGILVSPLASGASDNFAVNLSTAAPGDFEAIVKVWHNDPNAVNPHQFTVQATVNGPLTTTYQVIADAWVEQLSPNVNYGTRTTLETRATLSQMGRSTYLKFDVNGLSGTVQSAKLRIYAYANFPSSRMYWITDTTWSETGITWNNAPIGYNLQRELGSLSAGWVEIDVTDIITSNGLYTLGFTAADQPGLGFYSRELGYPASLVVTYQP